MTALLDGLPARLRAPCDFSWLSVYGRVFRVFDVQTSGNLCLGVEGKYGRLFVKFAGAQPESYAGRAEDAIEALRAAVKTMERLRHPALARLLAHGPAGCGYAVVQEWLPGDALSEKGDFYTRDRVRRLPLREQLKLMDDVYAFQLYAAEEGYIASDFHDGHVLIDFAAMRARVCDIDLYRPRPCYNDRGRMRGSPRFLAPEEYTLNAPLDERTVVFALGRLAREIFLKENGDWLAGDALRKVMETATRENRLTRYPSVDAFVSAWRGAVLKTTLYD